MKIILDILIVYFLLRKRKAGRIMVMATGKNKVFVEKESKLLPFGASFFMDSINFSFPTDQKIDKIKIHSHIPPYESIEEIDISDCKVANIYSFALKGLPSTDITYTLWNKDMQIRDNYGMVVSGNSEFGEKRGEPVRYGIYRSEDYLWKDDRKPNHSYEDSLIYRLHVRGFTKHKSSRVKNKGTFAGIVEKIDYLKDLGVTAVELLPAYEFDEYINDGTDTGKINYWGYGNAYYFAPKEGYSSKKGGGQVNEFKHMVNELHKANIEVIMDFYFVPGTNPFFIIDCLRHWVMEYHIDGVHLNMEVAPVEMIKEDPILVSVKIFADMWDIVDRFKSKGSEKNKNLAIFNDDFMVNVRRFIKSDEGQIYGLSEKLKRNPEGCGVINYIANHYSFTLMDTVSYDRKHNEANGENNNDGTDYNYSWNCGVEGPTKKKKIKNMRLKQIKNALTILFLSQGTPMIYAGDEMGRSRMGNNNPYCQDNDITWINWRLLETNREIYDYVKALVEYRKRHRVLHMREEPKNIDYLSVGLPDISFHGVEPWRVDFSYGSRQLAILYNGAYGENENSIYVALNAYWEDVVFNIPEVSIDGQWKYVMSTEKLQESEDKPDDKSDRANEDIPRNNEGSGNEYRQNILRTIKVPARSIVIFEEEKIRSKKKAAEDKRTRKMVKNKVDEKDAAEK